MTRIATIVFVLAIWGLFVLDRDDKARTSKALWIPVLWLLISGSRPVSVWLGITTTEATADQLLDGSPVDRLVYMGLLAAGSIVLVRRGPQVRSFLRANWPIVLFFLYCAASIVWSDYSFVAFKRWVKDMGDVVMVLLILTDPDRSSALKSVLARVGFLLVPLSVLFIKYYPDLGRAYNIWTWTPMYTGVTLGKNMLGMVCLIFGLGSFWRFLSAYRKGEGTSRIRRLVAHGAILVMVLWLFWRADSMTSLICFLLAGSLIAAASFSAIAQKQRLVHFLVAGMVLASFCTLFFDVGMGVVETIGRDPTITGRTAIWHLLLGMNVNPLIGTGFESFWLGKRLEYILNNLAMLNEAHNGYLEVFLNLGWIGVSLLVVVIVTGYRNIIAAFPHDPDRTTLRLAYFVVGVIYNLTEAGFRMLSPVWIFFLLAVTALPEVPHSKEPGSYNSHENLSLWKSPFMGQRHPIG
jgi:hypothetical protein